jgi:hypothetical protein
MKTRWAVTRKFTRDEDGKLDREEVISIASRDPWTGPPELPGLDGSDHAHKYSVIKVSAEVKIGMVRGGKVDASDGFGWQDEGQRVRGKPDEKPHYDQRAADERKRRRARERA